MQKNNKIVTISFVLMFCCAVAGKVIAQENLSDDLDSVQSLLKSQINAERKAKSQASSVAKEVKSVRGSLITAAKKIQDAEGQVSELEKKYKQLKRQEDETLAAITDKKMDVAKLIAVLQSMSLRPAETLIMQDANPVDALRSSILLRDIIPLITRETVVLNRKLKDLAAIREDIRQQFLRLKTASGNLRNKQKQMTTLLNKKINLQKNLETKAKQSNVKVKQLSKKAKDLQDLIAQIEKQKPKEIFDFGGETLGFVKMKGKIPLPVRGKISKKYGETLESGITSKGISVTARKNAQVVAPFDGTVVFAGPFRDYRDILIIDHGSGYHTLLAGMQKNDTVVGQGLLAGEPVGTLPESEPTLYVEIRKSGAAINPTGWFMN